MPNSGLKQIPIKNQSGVLSVDMKKPMLNRVKGKTDAEETNN